MVSPWEAPPQDVFDAWSFGWEAVAALGTLAAVVASLVIAEVARRSAAGQLKAQAAEFERVRRREHDVEILLRLAEVVRQLRGETTSAKDSPTGTHARTLLYAVPHVRLPITRELFLNDEHPYGADFYERLNRAAVELGKTINHTMGDTDG